ncbi:MAG: hypothetical protein LBU88_08945 [Treponema sp.]|jgi:hypothetical protein|nr:hypothetical protein [Treponema sp.]
MKRILLVLAAVLLVSGAAWGQFTPRESPTATATQWLFASDADNFISPSYYTDVEIEKAYIMSSFANNTPAIGYAATLGGIYLGLYYEGTLRVVPALTYVEESGAFPYASSSVTTYKRYTTVPYGALTGLNNNLAVLIGVADMGFAFYFGSTLAYFNEGDIRTGGVNYKSYEASRGDLMIGLGWGMAKDLTENGIRPQLRLDIVFENDYRAVEAYDNNTTYGKQVQISENVATIFINASMGEYTFLRSGGLKASFDVDLFLGFDAYDNEYSWRDNPTDNWKTEKIQGLYDGTNPPELEEALSFGISPSVGVLWESEKIDLGARFYLTPSFIYFKTTGHHNLPTTAVPNLRKSFETEISTFILSPEISLGTQIRLIPEKLSLVAGGNIRFSPLYVLTTDNRYFENTNDNNETSGTTGVTTAWGAVNTGLFLGLNFNLTKNVSFEAITGVNAANDGVGSISIFGTTDASNSITYFASILLSVKF